jgi:diacylglycerol kinase (ATP)
MTRTLVIGRIRKGRPIKATIRAVKIGLEAAGWKVETALVIDKADLRKRAAQAAKAHFDVVVTVGGDGGVLQVVQGLAETKVALGIIPLGTGNLLAGNLGIPKSVEAAIEVILAGHSRRIDLGRLAIGDKHRVFSVACGIGFDAQVMAATEKGQKLRWGKLAYAAGALRSRGHLRNTPHEITIDGRTSTLEAAQIFIANFGPGRAIKPRIRIKPDDGFLDVVVVRASGPIPALLAGFEALRQRKLGHSETGNIFWARAREVQIKTSGRLVEVDGSVIGSTPITVSIWADALSVLVPGR